MKKVLSVLIVLLLLTITASASPAFERGSKSVGGGASFLFHSGELYNDVTLLTISTKFSRALSYGTFFGAILEAQYQNYNSSSNTNFAFGFTYEKYLSNRENNQSAIPFIKLQSTIGSEGEIMAISLGLNFGIALMLSDALALEIGGMYNYRYYTSDGNSISGNIIQAKAGISTFIF